MMVRCPTGVLSLGGAEGEFSNGNPLGPDENDTRHQAETAHEKPFHKNASLPFTNFGPKLQVIFLCFSERGKHREEMQHQRNVSSPNLCGFFVQRSTLDKLLFKGLSIC